MTPRGFSSAGTWLASLSLLLVAGCGGSGGPTPSRSATLSGTFDLISLSSGSKTTTCPGKLKVGTEVASCSGGESLTFRTNGNYVQTSSDEVGHGSYVYRDGIITLTSDDEEDKNVARVELRNNGEEILITPLFTRITGLYRKR